MANLPCGFVRSCFGARTNTTVALSSSASSLARFVDGSGNTITSVIIAAGQQFKTVGVGTSPVAANKSVTLKATAANSLCKTTVLTVTP